MSIRLLGVVVLCVGILAVGAVPAQAQGIELSAGWNFLHLDTDEGDPEDLSNLPLGWYADVTGYLTPNFGLVGQMSGNYKSIDVAGPFDVDTAIYTFMGGFRAAGAPSNIRPYGQALFGAAHAKFSADDFDFDESDTDPALQLGAGVNLMSGGIGLRVGADWIRVFSEEDEGSNVLRFAVGVVFGQ